MSKPHSHYHKSVAHLESVDIYRLLELYGVTDPCRQHAIKKLFCAGQRGGKSEAQDIQEAIDTLKRKLQMLAEDAALRESTAPIRGPGFCCFGDCLGLPEPG